MFVCLVLAAILLPSVSVPQYVAEEVAPKAPTRPTARPKPTATPVDCFTLEEFELLGSMVFDVEPDFKEIDTDEFEWMYFHDDGIYGINILVSRGCVTSSSAVGVFDADYGDYEMLGELIGGMGGYFSTAEEWWDWLFDENVGEIFNCITYTDYDAFTTMRDGTDWYLLCVIDSDNDMNMGVRIDQ